MFMSNPHLAVLDLKTGVSTRMDWGFVSNFRRVDFRILRLSDDGNTLWSWGCVRNQGEGCTSRMFVINVGPDSPPKNNWTNATLRGPGTLNSGLRDFTVRGQPNETAFTFIAYDQPSTGPVVMGTYSANYVARGEIEWRSELQPVTVTNVDDAGYQKLATGAGGHRSILSYPRIYCYGHWQGWGWATA